jgi:hypothetical protein
MQWAGLALLPTSIVMVWIGVTQLIRVYRIKRRRGRRG